MREIRDTPLWLSPSLTLGWRSFLWTGKLGSSPEVPQQPLSGTNSTCSHPSCSASLLTLASAVSTMSWPGVRSRGQSGHRPAFLKLLYYRKADNTIEHRTGQVVVRLGKGLKRAGASVIHVWGLPSLLLLLTSFRSTALAVPPVTLSPKCPPSVLASCCCNKMPNKSNLAEKGFV